jgi:hypothetical protein
MKLENIQQFDRIQNKFQFKKYFNLFISNLGIGLPKTTYGPIDVQQRTFVRQLLIDILILIENVSMVFIARETQCQDLYQLSIKIITFSYLMAVVLKLVFYTW